METASGGIEDAHPMSILEARMRSCAVGWRGLAVVCTGGRIACRDISTLSIPLIIFLPQGRSDTFVNSVQATKNS